MKKSSDNLQEDKPSQVETDLVARNMADAFVEAVILREQNKGYLRMRLTKEELSRVSAERLGWHNMADAEFDKEGAAETLWRHVNERAKEELKSGMLAASVVSENQTPITYARFLARREALVEDWQPRGGQEMQMVQTLAQLQTLQDHWMQYVCSGPCLMRRRKVAISKGMGNGRLCQLAKTR